ncbi:MAG: clpB, partial [Propionibacteriaceae bacterium]|nr:clpB [Propionibacteriaceae bacterium]
LLQILEEGRLTDSQGRVVDFKNTVIIMTTNLGTRDISKGQNLGFQVSGDGSTYENMKNKVKEELKQHFRPEFLNRVDEIIVFTPLDESQLREIVRLLVDGVRHRLAESNLHLDVTDAALILLAREGYDPVYGARPLRRAIQRELENPLAKRLLAGEFSPGDTIQVDVTPQGTLSFNGSTEPGRAAVAAAAPGGSSDTVH